MADFAILPLPCELGLSGDGGEGASDFFLGVSWFDGNCLSVIPKEESGSGESSNGFEGAGCWDDEVLDAMYDSKAALMSSSSSSGASTSNGFVDS